VEFDEHLRTKIFDRSARRLMLTDAGASYVAAQKRILADISETGRTASSEYTTPTGELDDAEVHVTASPRLARFRTTSQATSRPVR